jgi:hypothetical protein
VATVILYGVQAALAAVHREEDKQAEQLIQYVKHVKSRDL